MIVVHILLFSVLLFNTEAYTGRQRFWGDYWDEVTAATPIGDPATITTTPTDTTTATATPVGASGGSIAWSLQSNRTAEPTNLTTAATFPVAEPASGGSINWSLYRETAKPTVRPTYRPHDTTAMTTITPNDWYWTVKVPYETRATIEDSTTSTIRPTDWWLHRYNRTHARPFDRWFNKYGTTTTKPFGWWTYKYTAYPTTTTGPYKHTWFTRRPTEPHNFISVTTSTTKPYENTGYPTSTTDTDKNNNTHKTSPCKSCYAVNNSENTTIKNDDRGIYSKLIDLLKNIVDKVQLGTISIIPNSNVSNIAVATGTENTFIYVNN